jgi:hypothetical protein
MKVRTAHIAVGIRMNATMISRLWREPEIAHRFRTGVCLHGHTMHSEECLAFLPRHLHHVPGVSLIVRGYQQGSDPAVDFSRAFWTPPLTPAGAVHLEKSQIEKLGLQPLVSLTDHDNVEACIALQVSSPCEVPLSTEWTVPYERSILHLGIHNLRSNTVRSWMSVMAAYTASPDERLLPQILESLANLRDVLIVLNHPFWLEEGILEADHERALPRVLRECNPWLHAFELNGTRNWAENRRVIDLASQWARPLISGGDRHACEPSACLNLTNALTFGEFVGEIRSGASSVLFMPQYREPMPVRLLEAVWDILRPYPEYAGRERWIDRVYYRGKDDVALPLATVWGDRIPWVIRPAAGLLPFAARPGVRVALRYLLSRQAEALQ